MGLERVVPVGVIAAVLATSAKAQTNTWVQVTSYLTARYGTAMAYDAARSEIVLFGGYDGASRNDTWVWNGTAWTQRFPATRPPARWGHAMAYDSLRGQVVLFGGVGVSGFLNDTWVWNGTNWVQQGPATVPPARYAHSMAFDAARGEIVLFGGWSGSSALQDTWAWDGAQWSVRSPAAKPTARSGHKLAYDAARSEVVLFGGFSNTYLNDTWVWNGSSWIQKSPAVAPGPRHNHGMVYDSSRDRIVLFGGGTASGLSHETWEWNGTSWSQASPVSHPPGRNWHSMAYDAARARTVIFSGDGGPSPGSPTFLNDTWEWDGVNWAEKLPSTGPAGRRGASATYDAGRGEILLFGGSGASGQLLGDTWIWQGAAWVQRSPAAIPSARTGHAMAYDPDRRKVVLFGGAVGSASLLNDTWEWDGTLWVQKSPPTSPTPREGHSMVFDSQRRRIVLFGGRDAGGALADTWVWDGNQWIQQFPASSPPARYGHGAAFDGARAEVVVSGGRDSSNFLNDTWVWDGTTWNLKSPASSPSPRAYHGMYYDAFRQHVILYGGTTSGGALLGDTWHWDGTTWTQASLSEAPFSRMTPSLVYDAARGHGVLFGGTGLNDTWRYEPPAAAPLPRFVTPGSGAGTAQSFTFVFEHPAGWQQLQVLNVLANFWLDGRQACYLAYVPSTSTLYLVDDAGNAGGPFAGSLTLNQDTGTISNSQCTISGANSWAQHDGRQVRLHLAITFNASFAGSKIVYLAARDGVANSGWQRLGVWTVPGASLPPGSPEVISLHAPEFTGRDPELVEIEVRDPNGAADIGVVNLLVNDWLDGRQACYLAYVPALNTVFLVNDAGDAGGPFAGSIVLGTSQTASNTQCTLYAQGSSAASGVQNLTLRLRMQLHGSFTGARVAYAAVRDQSGNNSGWQASGRRRVP